MRLARAGFTSVSIAPRDRGDVDDVLEAGTSGALGVTLPPPPSPAARVHGILRAVPGKSGEWDLERGADTARVPSLDEAVDWLVRRLG